MEFTIRQIADLLQGEIVGEEHVKISKLGKIQEASEGCIAFLDNPKYESFIYETRASAVIASKKFIPKEKVQASLILVDDPRTSFSILLETYHKLLTFSKIGIEEPSFLGNASSIGELFYRGAFSYIGHNTHIGKNVKIYPQVYIGDNVTIGNDCIIYAGSKIYSNSVIGNTCTIHSGAIIGSDGFGFSIQPDGSYKTIPQVGNVILEDNVSIGANTVIDCATMGSTIIKNGVKLDNLIQIAHNVEVGSHTVIAAQTGISGSTKIGDNCVIGGQAGFVGHISVANNTKIGAQAGVGGEVTEEGTSISGTPAFDYKYNLKSYAIYKKLPQILKRIEEMELKISSTSLKSD